jgi:hypothetical protein
MWHQTTARQGPCRPSRNHPTCGRRKGYTFHATFHRGWAVANQSNPDRARRSGLHVVWVGVRPKPIRWLQVQNLQARARAREQSGRRDHLFAF